MLEEIRATLHSEFSRDETFVLLGQDVGVLGGVYRATEGMLDSFPGRVFDTPLAEGGIVGSAIGLAVGGLKPVVELQFSGFAHQAFHQISQQLARFRSRSRGRFGLPVTVRAPYGGGLRMPEFHADSIESQLLNIPGLKVVCPAFPDDAAGLLRSALRDPDPVFFLEPQRLYRSVRGPASASSHIVPIGVSHLVKPGSDIVLIASGPSVHTCLEAAVVLVEMHGVSAGVLDVRTISPLDTEGIVDNVSRVGRAVVVHEGVRSAGWGAEVAAVLQEELFSSLLMPVRRVCGLDLPYPPGKLEDYYLPNCEAVVSAAARLE